MTRGDRPIRFGVQLAQEMVTWAELKEACQRVEEIGFDTLWSHDHFLPADPDVTEGPCMDGWATLAAMAALTHRIRVGCFVTGNTYRYPSVLAKMATTVDIISGGRLEFGLGAAWFAEEHQAYGIPFYTKGERIHRLDEALELIKMLWTSEENCNFNGRYYQLRDAPFNPKPLQKPHPPIMVGGGGEKLTLRVVAKWADAMNVFGSPQVVRHKISVLEGHCRAVGRNPEEIEYTIATRLFLPQDRPAMERFLQAAGPTWRTSEDEMLVGDFDRVRARVKEYVEVGVTHLILAVRTPYDYQALQGFMDEVVAAFR